MTDAPGILAFAGSTRLESVNKKFVAIGARAVEDAGGRVTLVDMADFAAPLYDADLEAKNGLPQTMRAFRALMQDHDGFLISSPEYNGFFPALIKNTLDWCTRTETGGENGMAVTTDKPVGLMSASPGGLGGIRAIPRLRDCLAEYGCRPVSGFATLPGAMQAFDDDGNLISEQTQGIVNGLAARLVAAAGKRP